MEFTYALNRMDVSPDFHCRVCSWNKSGSQWLTGGKFGVELLQLQSKEQMNTQLLDRPIAFHRCFVTLTGSVNAALMLSQAVYWQRKNEDGQWWFQTQDKWESETGLSRREQETARRSLCQFTFWKEEVRGLPGKLHFRVDLELLLSALNPSHSMAECAILQ